MYVFTCSNSNDMAYEVYQSLKLYGIQRNSRNGRVLMFPNPVTMIYTNPLHRCNFTVGRKANPIFHHMESMWMLAGREDVSFLNQFNSNIHQYSDDGFTFNASYGYRARMHFGHDQLKECIGILSNDPDSRQAVVQLWSEEDLIKNTKDKACNMLMVFSVNLNGGVDLIVFNRSNDAVYGGVTGANPVHFSYLLQYVAESLGRIVSKLTFVVNNLHVYLDLYEHWGRMKPEIKVDYPEATLYPLGDLMEIMDFCMGVDSTYIDPDIFESPTLRLITVPMYNHWLARNRKGDDARALHWLEQLKAPEWQLAITLWESDYELT